MTCISLSSLQALEQSVLSGTVGENATLASLKSGKRGLEKGATVEVVRRGSLLLKAQVRASGVLDAATFKASSRDLSVKSRSEWSVGDVAGLNGGLGSLGSGESALEGATLVSVHESASFSGLVRALESLFYDDDAKDAVVFVGVGASDEECRAAGAECSSVVLYVDSWAAAEVDTRMALELFGGGAANGLSAVIMPPKAFKFGAHNMGLFERFLERVSLDADRVSAVGDDAGEVGATVRLALELWFAHGFAENLPKKVKSEQVAEALNRVGVILGRNGEVEAANGIFRLVMGFSGGAGHDAVVFASNNVAVMLEKEGECEEAASMLEGCCKALNRRKRGKGAGANDMLCLCLANLAHCQDSLERLTDAETTLHLLLSLRMEEFGVRHRVVASVLNKLGVVLLKQGKVQAGRDKLQEALTILEGIANKTDKGEGADVEDPKMREAAENLALSYEMQANPNPAESDAPHHNHHVQMAHTMMQLAKSYKQDENSKNDLEEKAMGHLVKQFGTDHPHVHQFRKDMLQDEDVRNEDDD